MDPSSHTFDYKDLAVSVATNNKTGYQLTMSTTSTSLINTADDTLTIPTLDALSGGYTTSTFQTNKWGYSKDSGNYFPFPASELLLQNTTATNGDNTDLRFATKIDYTQPSGTYKTTISFNAVTNPLVDYIQDFTIDMCRTLASTDDYTVVDKRDDNDYTVRYINGNCWMTQNLRYIGDTGSASGSIVMKAATSNINADTTITFGDLSLGNDYSAPRLHIPTSTEVPSGYTADDIGAWYNYSIASATTIIGTSTTADGVYDICPAGWRLPNSSEQSGIISQVTEFSPVPGGIYNAGAIITTATEKAIWWSSTVGNSGIYRSGMYWTGSILGVQGNDGRSSGYYIRCIMDDTRTISDITTMQEISPQIVAKMTNGDTATLTDSRDNQDYTVAKINGNLWMTRNLAIGCNGTGSTYGNTKVAIQLTSSDSNVTTAWPANAAALNSLTLGNSYDDPRMECNATYGAYYNYAAASAGTIKGSPNTTEASSDICPAGWRLPTHAEEGTITGNATYRDTFTPVYGGRYEGGTIGYTTHGFWWSSTAASANNRYAMYFLNNALTDSNYNHMRNYGDYVRCIAN